MQMVTGYHNRSRNKGATLSPASGQAINLTTPVTYTVKTVDATRDYIVSVIFKRSISQQLWDAVTEISDVVDHQISHGHKLH
jgi:hypothetical protein